MSLDLVHPPLSSTSGRISSTLVAPFLFPFGLTSPARPPNSRQTIDAKPIDSWSRTRKSVAYNRCRSEPDAAGRAVCQHRQRLGVGSTKGG
jgi:hypothetical protein